VQGYKEIDRDQANITASEARLQTLWSGCQIPHNYLRWIVIELRRKHGTDQATELAIGLLGTCPVENINTDFPDLVDTVSTILQDR